MRVVSAAVIPGAFCHAGLDHSTDLPPPPDPPPDPPFQTDSTNGLVLVTLSPPTPVTRGWEAGSSTARVVGA